MPEPIAGEASEIIESRLDDCITELEDQLSADVFSFFGPLSLGIESVVRPGIEKIDPRKPKLGVVLETEGGYAEVVERMVTVFRRHYDEIVFVVPNYAMSAGTILCMSGDAIMMDYFSVLGPIDAQIPRPGGMHVSATGYLRQFERLMAEAKARQLTDVEMAYLIEKFDPADLYAYEQEEELSTALLEDWLAKYKFKNWKRTKSRGIEVTPDHRTARAKEIGKLLNDPDLWHSHGRGISMEVLRETVGLEIDDFGADKDLDGKIKRYYRLLRDYSWKQGHEQVLHRRGSYWGARV